MLTHLNSSGSCPLADYIIGRFYYCRITRIFLNLICTQFLAIFLNGKKLICSSDLLLSFNRPFCTGQLIH
jgi:hypothetical protein